jgi:hypothetical protein
MASREFLRDQFQHLQSDADRARFCLNIWFQEVWSRSEEERERLPENFVSDVMKKLEAAMNDVGRPDLYETFSRALLNYGRNLNEKRADAATILVREVMGELYPAEP